MTITNVIINPQTRNGAGVWMTSCPEEMVPRIWGFWRVSWELRLDYWGRELSSLLLRHIVVFFGSLRTEILNITRCAARQHSMVSMVRIVSLSSCRRTEVKKLINCSYLKQQSPSKKWLICPVSRVFGSDSEDLGSIPGHIILKTLKMVLDTSLLNTQQYKVRIKDKVEQSRERSSTLPSTSV